MFWNRGNILITWFITFAFTWLTKLCLWWCKRVTHCTSSMNSRWLHRSVVPYCWTWKIRCNWVINCRSWPCKCIVCMLLSKGIVFVHDNWRLCMFGQRVKLIILFVDIYMSCLTLSMTYIFSKLKMADWWRLIIIRYSTNSFLRIVFKTCKSIYFGYLSLELGSLNMPFIKN